MRLEKLINKLIDNFNRLGDNDALPIDVRIALLVSRPISSVRLVPMTRPYLVSSPLILLGLIYFLPPFSCFLAPLFLRNQILPTIPPSRDADADIIKWYE